MVKLKESERMTKPLWLKTTEEEMKTIIVQLAEKYPPAQIGIVLRDQYGIPTTKVYGKKLNQYLEELKIKTISDKKNAERKLERLQEHLKNNLTDKKAKHKIQKIQGKVKLLENYHSKKKSAKKND
jgi:small subunit ribosomal protein S15